MLLQTPLTTLDFATEIVTTGLCALATALCLRNHARASWWLGGFFASIGVSSAAHALLVGWDPWLSAAVVALLQIVNVTPAYLAGVMLYAHVAALLADSEGRRWQLSFWHLLPALLVFLYMLARLAWPEISVSALGIACLQLIAHAWAVIGVPYLAMAAWRLRAARRRIEDVCADETGLRLDWLRHVISIVALLWLLIGVERIIIGIGGDPRLWQFAVTLLDVAAAASVFLLAWSGLRSGMLLLPQRAEIDRYDEPAAQTGIDEALPPAQARYARSGLDETGLARVAEDLSRLMRESRLYADETLDLRALSERSGWSPNYISQALNQQLGRNFFEFVNAFRVAAAESCLSDPGDQRTALQIGLACGFGSKSTFNAVFKRMTGLTPSAFRRRAGASERMRSTV